MQVVVVVHGCSRFKSLSASLAPIGGSAESNIWYLPTIDEWFADGAAMIRWQGFAVCLSVCLSVSLSVLFAVCVPQKVEALRAKAASRVGKTGQSHSNRHVSYQMRLTFRFMLVCIVLGWALDRGLDCSSLSKLPPWLGATSGCDSFEPAPTPIKSCSSPFCVDFHYLPSDNRRLCSPNCRCCRGCCYRAGSLAAVSTHGILLLFFFACITYLPPAVHDGRTPTLPPPTTFRLLLSSSLPDLNHGGDGHHADPSNFFPLGAHDDDQDDGRIHIHQVEGLRNDSQADEVTSLYARACSIIGVCGRVPFEMRSSRAITKITPRGICMYAAVALL